MLYTASNVRRCFYQVTQRTAQTRTKTGFVQSFSKMIRKFFVIGKFVTMYSGKANMKVIIFKLNGESCGKWQDIPHTRRLGDTSFRWRCSGGIRLLPLGTIWFVVSSPHLQSKESIFRVIRLAKAQLTHASIYQEISSAVSRGCRCCVSFRRLYGKRGVGPQPK